MRVTWCSLVRLIKHLLISQRQNSKTLDWAFLMHLHGHRICTAPTGINLGEPLTLSELVDAVVDVVTTAPGAAQDSAAQPNDLTQGGCYGA